MDEIWNKQQVDAFLDLNPDPEAREIYIKVRFSTIAEYRAPLEELGTLEAAR